MLVFNLQIGVGFGAPPAVVPPAFSAPASSGLDDLFDLGGSVGMPMGAYSPPKTVSFALAGDISLNNLKEMALRRAFFFFPPSRFGFQPSRLKVWRYLARFPAVQG